MKLYKNYAKIEREFKERATELLASPISVDFRSKLSDWAMPEEFMLNCMMLWSVRRAKHPMTRDNPDLACYELMERTYNDRVARGSNKEVYTANAFVEFIYLGEIQGIDFVAEGWGLPFSDDFYALRVADYKYITEHPEYHDYFRMGIWDEDEIKKAVESGVDAELYMRTMA